MNAQDKQWIRLVKEGRRWRREVFCPQCGRRMDLLKEARYTCENPKCAVIEVRFRRDGAVEILLDSTKRRKT
ncbi:hypothetical protein KEJ34_03325 [Candidatus Bathyarchaeota archaeon]|nr:hypothetical protein [Candidatus Bathyarchaeota archaeon]